MADGVGCLHLRAWPQRLRDLLYLGHSIALYDQVLQELAGTLVEPLPGNRFRCGYHLGRAEDGDAKLGAGA